MTTSASNPTGCPYEIDLDRQGQYPQRSFLPTGEPVYYITLHDHGKYQEQVPNGPIVYCANPDDRDGYQFVYRIGLQSPLVEVPVSETRAAMKRGESFFTRYKDEERVRVYLQATIECNLWTEEEEDEIVHYNVLKIHLPIVWRDGFKPSDEFQQSDCFIILDYLETKGKN